MELTKKYEVILNCGTRLYVIGKVGYKLKELIEERIGQEKLWAPLLSKETWNPGFTGGITEEAYALSKDDFKKFNGIGQEKKKTTLEDLYKESDVCYAIAKDGEAHLILPNNFESFVNKGYRWSNNPLTLFRRANDFIV